MRTFDYSEIKNMKWDSEILNLVSQIREHKGKQVVYLAQKPEELDRLVEIAKLQSTEASNEIEGIRTTNVRLQKLYDEKTTPKNRDEEEILGYRDVLNTIHENFEYIPIKSNLILQLHRDLYKYTDKSIGGTFKRTQNVIASIDKDGTEHVIFTPLAPFETPSAIDAICDGYNKLVENEELDVLLLIPIFIHDFLSIHPFSDGNGRMSRLLTTLLLYKSGFVVGKYISLEKKIAKNKELYYSSLEKCQIGWHENKEDVSYFIKFLLKIILASYRDFEERIQIVESKVNAKDMVKKALNLKIGKITKSDLAELCPTISIKSIELALKQLVDENVLEKKGSGRATFYVKIEK